MELLSYVLSVTGTVLLCTPSLLKGKDMRLILLLVFLSNVSIGCSYLLVGAANGAVSCAVGAVQSIVNYFFDRKNKPLPLWLILVYAASFTVVNIVAFSQFADIFSLLACWAFVLCIAQKNGKNFRIWTLVNAVMWLTYDIVSLSFAPIITHAFQVCVVLFGMLMHDRKRNKE